MTELTEDNVAPEAVEAAETIKTHLVSDPDAVRKIVAGLVPVDDNVTVYPNKPLNLKYGVFNDSLNELSGRLPRLDDGESTEEFLARTESWRTEYETAEAEFEALKKQLADSAMTFHMVGISKKAIKNLRTAARKKFPLPTVGDPTAEDPDITEERDEYYRASIVAAHLVKSGYTIEDIESFRDNWPNLAWAQLWLTAQKLSIADDYLGKNFTNPDF